MSDFINLLHSLAKSIDPKIKDLICGNMYRGEGQPTGADFGKLWIKGDSEIGVLINGEYVILEVLK